MTTLAFCKPFRVLSQFSRSDKKQTLADFISHPDVYPAGRLDFDSEGLMLLTDNGRLQHAISSPRAKLVKRYWAQVEGEIDDDALARLRGGVRLKDGRARAVRARAIAPPTLWPRHPPIRERRAIPTSWLEIELDEGRNRQVRRMTAAVGFPTLRLVRVAIGSVTLGAMQPGDWRTVDEATELPAVGRR